jgi:hypothetical protein
MYWGTRSLGRQPRLCSLEPTVLSGFFITIWGFSCRQVAQQLRHCPQSTGRPPVAHVAAQAMPLRRPTSKARARLSARASYTSRAWPRPPSENAPSSSTFGLKSWLARATSNAAQGRSMPVTRRQSREAGADVRGPRRGCTSQTN